MNITLTDHQRSAADQLTASLLDKRSFRLGGYAGTGKTALASVVIPELRTEHRKTVRVVAPTGKAASVLRKKGVHATTIHGLIYEIASEKPLTFKKLDHLSADIVVCDESSMVPLDVYEDLCSFGKPILWIGDPGQLEPVGKDPKLMHNPDFVLSEVHRQALDNPIIHFATWLRKNPSQKPFFYAREFGHNDITKVENEALRFNVSRNAIDPFAYDQIIVGTNKFRVSVNQQCRSLLGLNPNHPVRGDKVICLANSRKHGVYNGMQFVVEDYNPQFNEIKLVAPEGYIRPFNPDSDSFDDSDPGFITIECDPDAFNCEKYERQGYNRDLIPFDYAYAITAHKSQGSEWDRVLVYDQAFGDPPNRWRYTAATRAKESLVWV